MITAISINSIDIGERLRPLDEEKTKEIAESISRVGLLNPILVRKIGDRYVLIAGRHRLAACELIGRSTIPACVYVMDDNMSRAMEITENLHRSELTALERATHIDEWVKVVGSIEEAAKQLNIGRDKVREAVKVASISPEARAAAKEAGIDNNNAKLAMVAGCEDQVGAVRKIAEAAKTSVANRVWAAWVTASPQEQYNFLKQAGLRHNEQ